MVGAGFLDQLGVGQGIGASTPYQVKYQPAALAFAIWGLIFPACILFGIYQALPSQRTSSLQRDVGGWSAFAFFATMVWELIAVLGAPSLPNRSWSWASYEWILSMVLLFGIALPLNVLLFKVLAKPEHQALLYSSSAVYTTYENLFIAFPLSIFCAWTTVASLVNMAGALCASGVTSFNVTNKASSDSQSSTVAYAACFGLVISLLIFFARGNVSYTCVYIWAYAFIAQVNYASDFSKIGDTSVVFIVLFVVSFVASKYYWQNSHFIQEPPLASLQKTIDD